MVVARRNQRHHNIIPRTSKEFMDSPLKTQERKTKTNQNQCLKKLESDRALALMVVSLWSTQTWGPQLLSLLIATPVILPQHKDLLTLPHNGMKHPLKTKLRMVVCLLSGSSIKRKEFHNQLPTCSWPPGEGAPKNCTMCTSRNGPSFVLKGQLINFSHLL